MSSVLSHNMNPLSACIRLAAFLVIAIFQVGCGLTEGLYSESSRSDHVESVHFDEASSSFGLLVSYRYYEIDSSDALFDALHWNSDRSKLNAQIRLASSWFGKEVVGQYRISVRQDRLDHDEIRQLTEMGFSIHQSEYSDIPVILMEGELQGQRLSKNKGQRLPLVFQDHRRNTYLFFTEAPMPKILAVLLTPFTLLIEGVVVVIAVPALFIVCTIEPHCFGG